MVISLILQKAKLPKAEKEAFEKELKANIKKVEGISSSDLHYTKDGEPQDQKLSKFFEEEVIDMASALQESKEEGSKRIKTGYKSVKKNINYKKVEIKGLEKEVKTSKKVDVFGNETPILEDEKKELKSKLTKEKKKLNQLISDYNKYIDLIFDKVTKHYVKISTKELDNLEVLDETKKPKKEEEEEEEKPESDFDVVGDKTVMEYLTSESNENTIVAEEKEERERRLERESAKQAKLEFLLYDLERSGHASQVVVELNKILERPATSYLESKKAQLPILVDIKLIMSEHKEKVSLLEEKISKEYNEIMKSIFDVLGVDAAVDEAVKEYQKDTKVKRNTINFNKKLISRLEDYKNKALNEKKLPDIYELLDAKTTSEMKNIYFYLKGLSKNANLIAEKDYDNKRKKLVPFKGFESSKTKSKVQIEGEYDSQEAEKYTSNNLGYGELMNLGKNIKELLLTEIEGSVVTLVDYKTLDEVLEELESLETKYENLKRRGEDKKDIMPPLLSSEIERFENKLQSYRKKLERFEQTNNLLGVLEDDLKEKESLILIGDERKKELQKKFSSLNIFLNAIGKEQKRR
jgi:hypothetical protein